MIAVLLSLLCALAQAPGLAPTLRPETQPAVAAAPVSTSGAPAAAPPAVSVATLGTPVVRAESAPAPSVLLLKGARVHVHAPGALPIVADVLIENGRIRSVEPKLEAPAGAVVIDLAGAHVLPGLSDALVGFDPDHDALYLDAGVTTVRDAGNALDRIQALREPAARDAAPGPGVLSALVRIEGNQPASPAAIQLENKARAEKLVPELIRLQPDWLYVSDALPLDVYETVAALGKEAGIGVWSSRRVAPTLRESIAAGQQRWLYMDAFLPEGVDWEIVQPGAFVDATAALGAVHGLFVPVCVGLAQRLKDPGDNAPILQLLSPMYVSQWEAERAMRKQMMGQPEYFKLGERVVKKQAALLQRLHAAGVQLVPGSGAPSPWIPPGQGLHDELACWVAAGVPVAQVLECATRGAAVALNLGAERGSVEPGKIADLLIVDADPLLDLGVLRKPRAVVLRGRLLPRAELDALVVRTNTRLETLRAKDREPLVVTPPELPKGTLVLSGYVELRALGLRVSGERWAVVREDGGSIAFVGHMLLPGDGTVAPRDMHVLQRVRGGELEEFEVRMVNGQNNLIARGMWIAGRFNVERRLNGQFLGGEPIEQHIAAVDVSSITTPLLLGRRERDATLPVLYLHDALVPELVPWKFELRENGGQLAQTPQGGLGMQIAPDGSISLWRENRGSNLIEARILESRADAGGLPLSVARLNYKRPPRADPAVAPAAPQGAAGNATPVDAQAPARAGG
jgi:hypothetical protein